MPIIPDTKNWTWVSSRRCLECGFDASKAERTALPSLLLANARAWPAVLGRVDVATRPDESTWSPLEYAAHVRDTIRLTHERVTTTMQQDNPLLASWDQDKAASDGRYNEQNPPTVAAGLVAAASALADILNTVPETAWGRPARRSDGSAFTLESLVRYLLHDVVHHLWDVHRHG